MSNSSRNLALALALLVAAAAPAPAQRQGEPRRPRLATGADTNDAAAYFQFGLDQLRDVQRGATVSQRVVDAFYWAERLDPLSPQMSYARHRAMLMTSPRLLTRYLQRDRGLARDRDIRAIDSLMRVALMTEPLLRRSLEELVVWVYAGVLARENREMFLDRTPTNAQLVFFMDTLMGDTDPYARGLLAYGRGELREAADFWARAARTLPRPGFVHVERARAFVAMRTWEAARLELRVALAEPQAAAPVRDLGYESRALWWHTLARVEEELGNDSAEHAAYGQAVAEDSAYYPAHLRLGVMALQRRDSAAAAGHLAAVARDSSFHAQAALGLALQRAGRDRDAVAPLRAAAAREPLGSATWHALATSLDRAGDTAAASEAWTRFLAVAPRADPRRPAAEQRLAALRSGP